MTLYGADLARIQAEGFADLARDASPELISILRRALVPIRRVYDIGCGAGVTTSALLAAGFETTAVEPSIHLMEIARTVAPRATFVHASAYEIELMPCDAVLAIGEVLTYHPPTDERELADRRVQAFFGSVASALVVGGRLVFDLIDADGAPLDNKGWRSEDAWAILWETREDRAAQRLSRDVVTFVRGDDGRYRRAEETHHVRLFHERDVRRWLDDAGFDVETARSYGHVALAPRRVAFIATRR